MKHLLKKLNLCSSSYLNDNERHVETIWPPMFGFRLLPTNSDLIIIKKLFRAANFSGAGGDEKLKIIFNWPYNKYSASFKVYSELSEFFYFLYNISFIDPPLGGFGDISLSDDIFLGAKPLELLEKYHHFGKWLRRIPRAEGLQMIKIPFSCHTCMSFTTSVTCVRYLLEMSLIKFHVVCTCTFFGDTIWLLTNWKMIKI